MERSTHHGILPYESAYGFARAVRIGSTIHVAGTGPVEPDGTLAPADPAAQMRRCCEIVLEAIDALGGSVAGVVRTRMYIVDPAEADAIGAVHGEVFGAADPASTMVVVAALVDPSWRVEIEVEAIVTP